MIFRKYEDALASILRKGWFDDNSPHTIYPNKNFGESKVPLIIPDRWADEWPALSEQERAMIYMNSQLKLLSTFEDYCRIDYSDLLSDSGVEKLFSDLELELTSKTKELIGKIRINHYDNKHLLVNENKTNPSILEEALEVKQIFEI